MIPPWTSGCVALGENMLATENVKPGLPRARRGGNEQRLIVIVAESDFLVECLAEVLKRRFPDHDVLVDEESGDLLREHQSRIRLVLFYRRDAADIARVLRGVAANTPSTAVGVLIDDPRALDPVMKLLSEDQHIDGILPLDVRLDVFLAGVELLVKGGEHFPSALLQRLRSANTPPGTERNRAGVNGIVKQYVNFVQLDAHDSHLTTREVEILDLLCKGTQNKLIAHRLSLSENTVKAHVRNIYKKLRVKNRTEAALRYFDGPPVGHARLPPRRN
jgi:DNA-binding NarL/FixJ family response regulator